MQEIEPAAGSSPAKSAEPSRARSAERRRDPEDTKERLLEAAERLFAQRGFEGTSLRAVTLAAGTSVSAAHYHFGSKEALLVATVRRHAEPVIAERFARLERLEREAHGGALPLEAVLDAFLRPIFEQRAARADGGEVFRRIAARLFSDPPEVVASLKREIFGRTAQRFIEALARALPDKPRDEIALDLQFLVGIMVHVTSGHLADAPRPPGSAPLGDLADEVLLRRMVDFVAAGLRSRPGPATPGRRAPR